MVNALFMLRPMLASQALTSDQAIPIAQHAMRCSMSRLLPAMLLACPVVAAAEPVFIEPVGPVVAGQILEAADVQTTLYPGRPCYLSLPDAGQMNAAEVSTGRLQEGGCWASPIGDAITITNASGNQTTHPKAGFVPARIVPGGRFEVMDIEADPL